MIAVIILVHVIITSHYFYGWPFDNLRPVHGASLTEVGRVRASQIAANTEAVYEQYSAVSPISNGPLPPFFCDASCTADQRTLVSFYNIFAVAIAAYILVFYFGFSSANSLYSLFYYSHPEEPAKSAPKKDPKLFEEV